MRILHIIGSMDPLSGGPCQGIRNSAQVLAQHDVFREVVCFDEPDAAYLGTDPFPVTALGKGYTPWQYNPKLVPWLRENLHRFDAVVSNGLWLYHTYAIREVLTKLRAEAAPTQAHVPRWYIMAHGMLDPYFQRASSRRLKALRNWLYWHLVENKVVKQADGLLFTCETELRLARQAFQPYKPQREINVGYGIATPPDYTDEMRNAFVAQCPQIARSPYLLFLSRLHHKKGVDLLLLAYLRIHQQRQHMGGPIPKLVIAGPGLDSLYGKTIQLLVQKHPVLRANVFFPGMLSGDAKWGAFYGCDAFVLPSHQENFGIAVTEALACARPVLISNQVNIWREIMDERAGLVESDSPDGIYNLLHTWLRMSKIEQLIMGRRAHHTFTTQFAVEPTAMRYKNAITGQETPVSMVTSS